MFFTLPLLILVIRPRAETECFVSLWQYSQASLVLFQYEPKVTLAHLKPLLTWLCVKLKSVCIGTLGRSVAVMLVRRLLEAWQSWQLTAEMLEMLYVSSCCRYLTPCISRASYR